MLDITYIQQLKDYLESHPCIDFDARTSILYPLLDEIYREGDRLSVQLQSGLAIDYLYRSNIAKEILLRDKDHPTHAWEPMTTRCVQLAIRHKPGSVLIGGAYFGDHALIAAQELAGANCSELVICVEPNKEQRAMLEHNAVMNNMSHQILLLDSVLWNASGLRFKLSTSDSHACVSADAKASHLSKTIDEILVDSNVNELSLILLDIEGSEEKALQGAKAILSAQADQAPVVIAEIHRNYVDWSNGLESTSIARYLLGHGYTVYALRDCQSNWSLELDAPEIIPLECVYLEGPPHGFNLIAAKDETFFRRHGFKVVYNVSPKYLRHRDPSLHLPLRPAQRQVAM